MYLSNNNLNELKLINQWVNYIMVWDDRKQGYTKPPINPHILRYANTKDKNTWSDYDRAVINLGKMASFRNYKGEYVKQRIEGVGFVLANGFCGVDLDHVLNDQGEIIDKHAKIIIAKLDTYTEVSPSGDGLHCILYAPELLPGGSFSGEFPLDAAWTPTEGKKKRFNIEVYYPVDGGRYFTITGNVYRDRPINHNKGKTLIELYKAYYNQRQEHYKKQSSSVSSYSSPAIATGENDRKMVMSALSSIRPSELNFNEWAAIMTALKVTGHSLSDAESWSSGNLSGEVNSKNDSKYNERRWPKFRFKGGDSGAIGIIINQAKKRGWKPGDAFTPEDRSQFGKSLYTEEQRKEYGKKEYEKAEMEILLQMAKGVRS